MKKILIILLITFFTGTVNSQTFLKVEVIDTAKYYLQTAVGNELYKYFKLDPDSYYEYKTKSGKTKWENINKGKRTKGIFVNGKNIRFVLEHPEFPYLYVNKSIYVPLTSELGLESEISLYRIPSFLLEGRKSDWLNTDQLDSVIIQQNLKKSNEVPKMRLEFDTKERKYYWIVFNTLYKEKCYSDEEILHIDPISGLILKHYEGRHYVVHCY